SRLRSPLGLPVLRLVPCVCMPSPLPRQVRWNRFARTLPSTSAFPRLQMGRHLHYQFRGLLSVHSCYNLQTCRVALCDPLHRRLRRLCCLHRCSDCYRAERSSSRAGLSSRCGPAHFTAHCKRLTTATMGKQLTTRKDFFQLLQLCVLRLGLLQDRDVGVGDHALQGSGTRYRLRCTVSLEKA